jgi:hypothetical protein
LLIVARENHWAVQVFGKAPMVHQPIRVKKWLLVPATMDSTALPDKTMQRLHIICDEGIRPQGFVMVHEAPMQLKGPSAPQKPEPDKEVLRKIGGAALGLGILSGSLVVAAGVVILSGLLILPAGLLAAAALIDPILVAVMPDNTWVEIDRWEIE